METAAAAGAMIPPKAAGNASSMDLRKKSLRGIEASCMACTTSSLFIWQRPLVRVCRMAALQPTPADLESVGEVFLVQPRRLHITIATPSPHLYMPEDEFQMLAFVFGAYCTYIYMNAPELRELVHKTCTREIAQREAGSTRCVRNRREKGADTRADEAGPGLESIHRQRLPACGAIAANALK